MAGPRARCVVGALALGATITLSGCADDQMPLDTAPGGDSATPSSSARLPLSAGPPAESEVPPGSDESPDGAAPPPDDELSDADLTALLRTRGSEVAGSDACDASDVSARLSGFDAATGHRYTSLVVTNTSTQPCVVAGVPGIGARGEWGHRFTLTVQRSSEGPRRPDPVRLDPGDEAGALVEWTGELAGAQSEHASLVAVQLADGQVPIGVPADLTGTTATDLDIGMFTTILLGAFEPRP